MGDIMTDKSRMDRPGIFKLGQEVAHMTHTV